MEVNLGAGVAQQATVDIKALEKLIKKNKPVIICIEPPCQPWIKDGGPAYRRGDDCELARVSLDLIPVMLRRRVPVVLVENSDKAFLSSEAVSSSTTLFVHARVAG